MYMYICISKKIYIYIYIIYLYIYFLPLYIYIYTYAIMKTMSPPVYHQNGFVATRGNSCTWANDIHHAPNCMSCHKAIW